MPPLVAALVYIGFSTAIATSIVVSVVLSAISFVVQLITTDSPTAPPDQGVKQRIPTDPKNKLPAIYGEVKAAGQITMADIKSDNQVLYFIISLCEGDVESIDSVIYDDKVLTFDGDIQSGLRSVTNAVGVGSDGSDEDFDFLNDGRLKIRTYPAGGRCSEMELNSSRWSTNSGNRTMPNTAYAYIELTYSRKHRVTGLSTKLRFGVKGKKVRTFNGSGNLSTALTYSNNPAEVLVDFLTSNTYGGSLSDNRLDLGAYQTLKTFCDNQVMYEDVDGVNQMANRYSINGSINTNNNINIHIADIISACASDFTYTLGKFGVIPQRTVSRDSETVVFGDNNISLGDFDIVSNGLTNKLNKFTGKYNTKDGSGEEQQVILTITSDEVKNKNEPLLEQTFNYTLVNNNIQAERLAAIKLNSSRLSLIVKFTTSIRYMFLQSGDLIEVASDTAAWPSPDDVTAGYEGKQFIILSLEQQTSGGGAAAINITAVEYGGSVYADRMIVEMDPAPNTGFPNPYKIPGIGTFQATDNSSSVNGVPISALRMTWDNSDPFLEEVEVRYLLGTSVPANPTWIYLSPSRGNNITLSGLEPSSTYQIGYRIIGELDRISDFVTVSGTTISLGSISGLNARGEWPSSGDVTVNQGDFFAASPSTGTNPSLWFSISSTAFTVPGPTPQQPKDQAAGLWNELASVTGATGPSYPTFRIYQNKTTVPTLLPSGTAVDSSHAMTFVTSNAWTLTQSTPGTDEDTYVADSTWKDDNDGTDLTVFSDFNTISRISGTIGRTGLTGTGTPGISPELPDVTGIAYAYNNSFPEPSDEPITRSLTSAGVYTISGNGWTAIPTDPEGGSNRFVIQADVLQTASVGDYAFSAWSDPVINLSGRSAEKFTRTGFLDTTPVVGDVAFNNFALAEIIVSSWNRCCTSTWRHI